MSNPTFEVTDDNNFCRIFMLPREFSSEYCFGGGIPTNFQMVNWLNPLPMIGEPLPRTVTYDDLNRVTAWMQKQEFLKPGRTFLVLFEFGAAITFKTEARAENQFTTRIGRFA